MKPLFYQNPPRRAVARSLARYVLIPGLFLLLTACAGPFDNSPAPSGGHILIDGSTALFPLVQQAAELFQKHNAQVRITVNGGGSLTGLNDVTSHKVAIGDSDVYADPATYPDPNLTDHLICIIPFTVIAAAGVPVSSLTREQLIGIFATGSITNWKQVGGPNLPIVPIVRPATSGTRATFRKYVLSGRDELSSLRTIDSSQHVVETVGNTPGAIGYLAASVLDTSVHVVNIDGYAPTLQNIETGRYSFWSYEHMYTLNVSAHSPVAAFLNFMLSAAVQQAAQAFHYLPISEMQFSQAAASVPVAALAAPGDGISDRKRSVL